MMRPDPHHGCKINTCIQLFLAIFAHVFPCPSSSLMFPMSIPLNTTQCGVTIDCGCKPTYAVVEGFEMHLFGAMSFRELPFLFVTILIWAMWLTTCLLHTQLTCCWETQKTSVGEDWQRSRHRVSDTEREGKRQRAVLVCVCIWV